MACQCELEAESWESSDFGDEFPDEPFLDIADEEAEEGEMAEPGKRVQVPEILREVLLEFSIAYLLEQPPDIIDYALDFFQKMQTTRRLKEKMRESYDDGPADPNMSPDDVDEDEPVVQRLGGRRKSVFAEAYDPENDADEDEGAGAVYPKTDAQRARLIESVKNVLLFRSLEKEQMNQVLDAMFERQATHGEIVIRQGDDGDNFYVIESGVYKVIVNDKHIHTYDNAGIFGELALLYNMPRAATIICETSGRLWAMDRPTFRRILLKHAFKKRKLYEELLDSVPMLKTLQPYERMNLADALISQRYQDGERIITQGDDANGMYFIEEGFIAIKISKDDGKEIQVSKLGKGEYFGELALVTHRPRAASAYAIGEVKVAFLETVSFERILGGLHDVLARRKDMYEEQLKLILENSSFI